MPQCWAHIWFGTEKVLIHQTRFHPSPGAQFLANCRKLMFRISRPADLACREMIFQFRHGAPWIALDVFACLFVFFFGGNRVVHLFYKKKGVTEFETQGTCNILREHCSSFRLSYSRLAATFVAGGSYLLLAFMSFLFTSLDWLLVTTFFCYRPTYPALLISLHIVSTLGSL